MFESGMSGSSGGTEHGEGMTEFEALVYSGLVLAAAGTIGSYLYYTFVAKSKYNQAKFDMDTILKIHQQYHNGVTDVQRSYLDAAQFAMRDSQFAFVLIRFTAKRIDVARQTVRRNLVASARQYIKDLKQKIPKTDEAVIARAITLVNDGWVVGGNNVTIVGMPRTS